MLTKESFARARSFIEQTARPVERALFQFEFAGGSREAVVTELAKFQNADGGFASNLESDVRWRGSSSMATMIGLRILTKTKAPSTDAHVQAAVRYLLATFDQRQEQWHALPWEVNSAAHAPWWQVHEDTGKCEVESHVFPTAAIAGYLRAYPGLLPAGFLERITKSSLKYLAAAPPKMQMPDIEMLTELVRLLPDDMAGKQDAVEKLRTVLAAVVVRDPQQWSSYGIRPLTFVHSPNSPYYGGLEKVVAVNLDFVISDQRSDGGWEITWSWEHNDAAAFAIAKKEWRGVVTLESLERLERFHRIEH